MSSTDSSTSLLNEGSSGTNVAGVVALLHHLSVVVEEEKTPHSNGGAALEFAVRHHGKDDVPDIWHKETFGRLHFDVLKILIIISLNK